MGNCRCSFHRLRYPLRPPRAGRESPNRFIGQKSILRRNKMADGAYRVVVWATGGIGSIAIRAIQRRPHLALGGVWVHAQKKGARAPAEPPTGEPIGLAATDDANALIALKPDAVIYA